ncbi:melanocortin receptor 5-like [Ruditapes philippinarum]|uniref:melanocortin receptor 5-like n=1 Tax=Ruditapes philippinarum TaxID=129788 RepID=UPI00295B92C2|nr:melanocortin receptor 5-like [Ruditapes philippinarum]
MLSSFNFFNTKNATYKTESAETGEKSFDLDIDLEDLLASLSNTTEVSLQNITESLLKSSLWPSLQPYNWKEQAEKILQQPEYIVILILCIFALLTNILSIIAVSHIKHSLTTHLKLIINLAVSDIIIVISVLIHIVNKIFNYTMSPLTIGMTKPNTRLLNSCFFASINSLNIMSFLIVLLNLLAMAMDHYIAIMKPYRYPYIMSKRNGYILIACMWLLAALGGFSNFIFGTIGYHSQTLFNICEYIMYDNYHAEYLIFGVTLICLFAIIFIYMRIFFEVRRIQAKMQFTRCFTLHNKKALITTLLIIGTFILCWMPNCIFQLTMIVEIHINKRNVYKLFDTFLLVSKYLYILQLANCLFDPIIYAVRLKIVKKGYLNFLKRLQNSFNKTKSFVRKVNKSRTQTETLRRRTFTRVPIEVVTDAQPHFDSEIQTADFDNKPFLKMSDESDVNDNELIPMVTFHEHSAAASGQEQESTMQEIVPIVTIHSDSNFQSENETGHSMLQNNSTTSFIVENQVKVLNSD